MLLCGIHTMLIHLYNAIMENIRIFRSARFKNQAKHT